jgi:hypothetical protein
VLRPALRPATTDGGATLGGSIAVGAGTGPPAEPKTRRLAIDTDGKAPAAVTAPGRGQSEAFAGSTGEVTAPVVSEDGTFVTIVVTRPGDVGNSRCTADVAPPLGVSW